MGLDGKTLIMGGRKEVGKIMTTVNEQIADVMELLESIPQGGVGAEGASPAEIVAAENAGHSVEDDAVYHVVQKAWLMLREVLA